MHSSEAVPAAQAQLAELLVAGEWRTPPPRERIVDCLSDFIAAVLAGWRMPAGRAISRRYAGEGARGLAFAVSYLAELSEFSHGHNNSAGHVGSTTLPVALALASRSVRSDDVTAALLMGYEAFSRVGSSMMPALEEWGSVQTGFVGSVGAAATAAGIAGLDARGMRSALGIAAYLTPLTPVDGYASGANSSEAAAATMTGILAGELATDGFEGPGTLLDDLYRRIVGRPPEAAFAGPWPARDRGIDHLYFKPYPCCRFTHGAIQAALEVLDAGLAAGEIDGVQVAVTPRAFRTCSAVPGHLPTTYLDRQFSIAYLVAAAFLAGRATAAEVLTPSPELDEAVLNFASRVHVEASADLLRYGNICPCRLTVRLRNGDALNRSVLQPRGCPSAPLTRADVARKLEQAAETVLGAAQLEQWTMLIDGLEWVELSERVRCVLPAT